MYPYMLERKPLVLVDGYSYSHKVAILDIPPSSTMVVFQPSLNWNTCAWMRVYYCMLLSIVINYPFEDSYNTVYYDV